MLENKGGTLYRKRTQKDYSLAFKMQVIDEVEKGRMTYKEAQHHFGIQGRSTVLVWLRKHGSLDWNNTDPMAGRQTPNKKIRELEKRIRRLEAEKLILNTAIDVADELYDTNIRKKYLPLVQQSSASNKGVSQADTERSEEQQP